MSDTVTVRFLFFRADIYLDRLEDMPLRNFKKLLRIAAKDTQLNAEAIQRLREHFERTVPDARTTMQAAAKAYLDGYKEVNSRSRKKAVLAVLKENQRLKAAFTSTKVRHDKIIKLKDAFFDTFPATIRNTQGNLSEKENKDYVSE